MSTLLKILTSVYFFGFVGGMPCGLLVGYLAVVIWRRVRRKQRQVSAEQFARELGEWVREMEEEKAKNGGPGT